jgi:excisionase family DNA binding protein
MQSYFTPEELAQQLKIEVEDLMALIVQGKLKAIRIGTSIRIPEMEVEKMHVTCAAVSPAKVAAPVPTAGEVEALPEGSRWCLTRTGRAKFRVSGSVATGAEIWPGQMRYPIKFPKSFMDKMLAHFKIGEFPIGGKFDDPGQGSLGEFIQQELKIKMNPAVYLAALLTDEGYADSTRRGFIRLRPNAM